MTPPLTQVVTMDNIPVQRPSDRTNASPVAATKQAALVSNAVAQKKLSRRSSKPIINWLQRKLAGSVRARRVAEGTGQQHGNDLALRAKLRTNTMPSRNSNRTTSAPIPFHITNGRQQDGGVPHRRTTISLVEDDDVTRATSNGDDMSSYRYSMGNRSSRSGLEADDDASLRPIPPSAPPSPSPSRSSSSYMSDPRTFRSLAASTKPTTVLSVDVHGGGMAHIAEAPNSSPLQRLHRHTRSGSTNTNPGIAFSGPPITFSALPPSTPEPTSRPSSLLSPNYHTSQNVAVSSVQAPLHTTHHPRNNPRPLSPPLDNASLLTLASSAFALPAPRADGSLRSAPLSAGGPSDSISHFGGGSLNYPDAESTSQYLLGFDERLDDRDVDASVRALRPRSSRRGSWESEVSRWSARAMPGNSSVARDLSLWTATSAKTEDAQSTEIEGSKHEDAEGEDAVSVVSSEPAVSPIGAVEIAKEATGDALVQNKGDAANGETKDGTPRDECNAADLSLNGEPVKSGSTPTNTQVLQSDTLSLST